MKLNSKVVVFCVGAMLAVGVSAETLYWQVTDYEKPFDYAQLYVTQDGTYSGGAAVGGNSKAYTVEDPYTSTSVTQTNISSYSGPEYSFYVELFNSSNEKIGRGQIFNYNNLAEYIALDTSFGDKALNNLTSRNFSMGTIPEPTSGLLFLMGGAVLALRRRRRV